MIRPLHLIEKSSLSRSDGEGRRSQDAGRPRPLPILAFAALLVALLAASPLAAKDSLGVFGDWGAFRDPATPRCYAIAVAEESRAARDYQPYASVGTWPRRDIRGQFHVRLSRKLGANAAIQLTIGDRSFALTGGGGDGWAQDRRMDAAIQAAMRAARTMQIRARDERGRNFTDRYSLDGVASALDAAIVGCARLR